MDAKSSGHETIMEQARSKAAKDRSTSKARMGPVDFREVGWSRRMAAPAVETKRQLEVQRPPDAGPVAERKNFRPGSKSGELRLRNSELNHAEFSRQKISQAS
jgi:hypothetical protein